MEREQLVRKAILAVAVEDADERMIRPGEILRDWNAFGIGKRAYRRIRGMFRFMWQTEVRKSKVST